MSGMHRGKPHGVRFFRAAVIFLATATVMVSTAAPAAEQDPTRKVGRGLAGIVGGFLEVPGNVIEETRMNGAVWGMTIGLGRGLGMFLSRELVGVYEVLTAPFEVPSGFEPIIAPEFSWEYFDFGDPDFFERQAREVARIPGAKVTRRGNSVVVSFPEGLLFASGSTRLSAESSFQLNSVARAMVRYPNLTIAVTGYADSTGDTEPNVALSQGRAASVRGHLLGRGVPAARIAAEGMGEERPVASNATRVGRRQNRRAELRLQSSGVAAGAP